jgi:hypothetical protein
LGTKDTGRYSRQVLYDMVCKKQLGKNGGGYDGKEQTSPVGRYVQYCSL